MHETQRTSIATQLCVPGKRPCALHASLGSERGARCDAHGNRATFEQRCPLTAGWGGVLVGTTVVVLEVCSELLIHDKQ